MKVYFALGVMLFAVGCGSDDKKDSGATGTTGPELTGTWKGECEATGSAGSRTEHVFTAKDYTMTITGFTTTSCDAGTELQVITVKSTYERVNAAKHSTGATALNATYTDITLTPKSDDAVTVFSEGVCGKTSWTKGQATSLKDGDKSSNCTAYSTFIGYIGQTKGMYYLVTDSTKLQFVDRTNDTLSTDVFTKQ